MPSLSELLTNNNVYGYRVRQPYLSENTFFKRIIKTFIICPERNRAL